MLEEIRALLVLESIGNGIISLNVCEFLHTFDWEEIKELMTDERRKKNLM